MTTSTNNKPSLLARCQSAAAGITQYLSSTSSLMLNGTVLTPADAIKLLSSFSPLPKATADAKATWQQAVKTEKATRVQVLGLLRSLRSWVRAQWGANPVVLAAFGFATNQTKKPSAQTKADAVKKVQATRKARLTGGKRQKAKVHADPQAGSQGNGATVPVK